MQLKTWTNLIFGKESLSKGIFLRGAEISSKSFGKHTKTLHLNSGWPKLYMRELISHYRCHRFLPKNLSITSSKSMRWSSFGWKLLIQITTKTMLALQRTIRAVNKVEYTIIVEVYIVTLKANKCPVAPSTIKVQNTAITQMLIKLTTALSNTNLRNHLKGILMLTKVMKNWLLGRLLMAAQYKESQHHRPIGVRWCPIVNSQTMKSLHR